MSIYDSAAFAGLLCQLCGTLSGFAVAGLIFVVALRPPGGSMADSAKGDLDIPVALLTSAFIGLTLTALSYALMAGEPPDSQRLASEQVIAGVGFGAGALVLLYAVRRLVCVTSPSLDVWTRHMIGIGAPCVVWLYLAEGTRYVGWLCETDQGFLWLVLGSTATAQVAASVTAYAWPRRAPMPEGRVMRLASTGAIVPTVCALAVATTPTLLPNDTPSPMWVLYLVLSVGTGGLAYYTLHVGRAVRSGGSSLLD